MDEIIARHIQPMASHARDIINFKNYLESDAGKKEILEKKLYEDKKKAPSRLVIGIFGLLYSIVITVCMT